MRIKEVIKEKGLTITDVAKLTGMRVSNISQMFEAGANPTLGKLTKIANAIGVPVSEFIDAPKQHVSGVCPHCGKKIEIALKRVH